MPLNDTLLEEADSELVAPRRRTQRLDAPVARSRPRTFELSDDAEMQLKELARSSRPMQSAPEEAAKAPKPLGLMGAIREGAKGTMRSLGATADTMQGDAQGVVKAAQEQAAAPKDPDLERFYSHIEESKKALGDNPSLWEGIKAVGSAAIDNPRGFGLMVAEQLPNSGVALGAAGAGALAGSFAGPIGSAVGGLAGLASANIGLETGAKALEAGADNTFTPEERSNVLKEGLIKGGVITGVDAATLGVTKFITNASRRAVESATTKALADRGVDVTSEAARKAAMQTPEIADAVKSAQELAKQGAQTLGKRLARTGGAVALETIGEGAGEYLGELAATGKANAVDAVIEGFAGLGTSIGEIATTSALNRKGLNRLLDTQEEAEKTAETETKETGVEHEVIKSPTEPEKFVAVPKVRSISGIELERDEQGNLKPKAPVSTQADFNLANKQGFELTAEDKIRQREIERERPPIVVTDKAPSIAGRPATELSNDALEYTLRRGGENARKVAAAELQRRKSQGIDPAIANAPEKPEDTAKRIIVTGAEKAQEDRKSRSILAPATTPNVQPAAPMPAATSMPAANLQVVLPDNTSLPAQWDVVDADSVKATIKEGKNQPRDRSRAASDIQVQGIASNPDYRRLADSPVMDVGSPTLSHDGLIVGGNGRFEGISRAYDQGTASEYLARLKADAAAKGIDPAKLDGMKKPVLVRRITQPFDVRKLAIASNSGTGLQYSGLELAKIDAERMRNLENLEITDSGDIALTSSNIPNIRNVLSSYSAAELGALVDKDGVLSQEGVRRIRGAILHSAYGSNSTLERIIESTDNDLRNISGALVRAAPAAMKAKADIKAGRLPKELDISEQLVGAVETLSKIRVQGQSVDEHLSQAGLFGEEINEDTKAVLRVLEANIRSQKKIAEFIRTYYDSVSSIDTSTDDIFGAPQPKKPDLIKNAKDRITEKQPETKDLFSRPTGSTRTESAKQSPDNGGTSKSSEKDQQQVKKEETKAPKASGQPKRLDHGELNVKGRTNTLNKELDKYKKEQAELARTKAKASAQQTREEKALAKSLLNEYEKEILEKHKAKFGEKELKNTLDQWAKWEPQKLISFVDRFIQEKTETSEKTEKEKPAVAVRGDQKPVPRGGRILANGIAETIQKNGVAALVGQKITSPERLAELAQVYRNPQYETFRIFFTKGNQIVHASGVTARMPGTTPIFPKDMDSAQGAQWVRDMMRTSGADGYWILHNHPSGNPTPSSEDVQVTNQFKMWVPGLKGHVVINSNKYAQIMPIKGDSEVSVIVKDFGEDKLLKASKPHQYIGREVPGPGTVMAIGKSLQKEGWVTLIGTSGDTGVRAIAEIPLKTFTTPGIAKAAIRRFSRRTGAQSVFAYGASTDLKAGNARTLIEEGFLRDAVDEAGNTSVQLRSNSTGKVFGQQGGRGGVEVKQNAAQYNPSPSIRDRFDKITDSLIYNFQDRFKPLKDIQKRAGPVAEDEDAALAEERYSGMVRARMDTFEEQLRDPLIKAIHDSGVSYEEAEEYLHALHAPSRNAAMKEINPTEDELKTQISGLEKQRDTLAKDQDVARFIQLRRELRQAQADVEDGIADESLVRGLQSDIAQVRQQQNVKDYAQTLDKLKALRLVKPFKGDNTALSGMSDKQAKDIIAKADKNGTRAKLDKVSAIVDSITARTRQIYVDGGLEKADAVDAWNQKYEHYVPLHRDEVGGNTMPKVGQGFNIRGKESKRATGSTKQVTDILAHVVAQHEAAIIRSEKARVDRALFQFASTHPDPSLWTLDDAPKLRTVDPVSGFVVERVDPTYKNRPEVLTLKIDGEEHTITFNDQNLEAMRLAASMKNLSSQELGEVTQLVGRVTRFLATMNTTMNPVFVARNFMRDMQTTYVNLSDTALAQKKAEVFRDIPAAIKGMWNLSRGKGNSQWAKYAQAFKAAGGQTGWMDHYKDIGTRAEALKKELSAMQPGKLNLARRTGKAWLTMIEDANNAVENGARLSAYVNARKAGLSEGKAAQLAKNLTVNFNARGAKSVELNAWYMFMNASIQGSARLIKAMGNRQVRKITAGIILSGFLMDIMARSMAGDDDEDGENDYDQLPEHTKAMNFVFMIGGQPVTIPMPYGYNFFASTGRKISEMMFRENYSPVKSAADLAAVFLDAFSPTGQAGSALQFAAPTVADPFVQWAENRNFAGNPLRKDQNPFGPPKPEYQMGFKSTSAPAKWLAEALNDTTGGNEVRPGFVNVNPVFFDFAVSSILGGAGRTYLQIASGPLKAVGDDEIQAREIPFANIFVGARPEYQTERKYFEAVEDVETAVKELTTYRQKGDTEMVREIREEHGRVLRLREAAKATKELLARLRKRDLALDKQDLPNKAELRREIEEKKREAMSRFNKKYREAITAD